MHRGDNPGARTEREKIAGREKRGVIFMSSFREKNKTKRRLKDSAYAIRGLYKHDIFVLLIETHVYICIYIYRERERHLI